MFIEKPSLHEFLNENKPTSKIFRKTNNPAYSDVSNLYNNMKDYSVKYNGNFSKSPFHLENAQKLFMANKK